LVLLLGLLLGFDYASKLGVGCLAKFLKIAFGPLLLLPTAILGSYNWYVAFENSFCGSYGKTRKV
jgi:hypothetical protein